MPIVIDDIQIDESNEEFFLASELVKYNQPLIYLTGKAGTGKTTFLKYIRQTTEKNTVVLAFTGVAALNAGGQTINSFFNIPFGPFVPNDVRLRTTLEESDLERRTIYNTFQYNEGKLNIIRGLELLIIDEISMVRCDLLDVIDRLLRVFRKKENEAFGGVQVVLIGDVFQLPPVDNEWHILQPFYESIFFFSSRVFQENNFNCIELQKIYKQTEEEFISLLNRVRVNQVAEEELNLLNSRYDPLFNPGIDEDYITLSTHIEDVNNKNLTKLDELPGPIQIFEATIISDFPERNLPTDRSLQLKEGAQIIFIKNDKANNIFNGKIAKICKINGNEITASYEEDREQRQVIVEKHIWKNIRYVWNEEEQKIVEEVLGQFIQYPIKLAWAITVHKSQGLTFEKVILDVSNAFVSGQVYVALSRCTTFNGLILKSNITRESIIVDPKVIEFAQNITPNTVIVDELKSGKADFYYKRVREEIKALNFESAFENFKIAIKFRNDLETDLFKRYFVTTAQKLSSYRNLLNNEKSKYHKLEINQTDLETRFSELEHVNLVLVEKNNQQNKVVKNLLDKIGELEKDFKELQRKNETLKNKNNGLGIEISEVKSQYFESVVKIKLLEEASEAEKKEAKILMQRIIELRNKKWYQLLLNDK